MNPSETATLLRWEGLEVLVPPEDVGLAKAVGRWVSGRPDGADAEWLEDDPGEWRRVAGCFSAALDSELGATRGDVSRRREALVDLKRNLMDMCSEAKTLLRRKYAEDTAHRAAAFGDILDRLGAIEDALVRIERLLD